MQLERHAAFSNLYHQVRPGLNHEAAGRGETPANRRLSSRPLAAVLTLLVVGALPLACKRAHSPDVVATVNGKAVQRNELEKYYVAQLGESKQQPSKEQADTMRLTVLRTLIEEEIVLQRAAKLNLVASDQEVEDKVNEIKARYTAEQFDRSLKEQNLTLDELRRNFRRSLTEDKLFNKEINSKITVTDGDIAAYYNTHKADFNLIEPEYHLAQIAVSPTPSQQPVNLQNDKATNDAQARKKIETLRNRLETGEDFGALAANFSEDPATASNGGDLGMLKESQLRNQPQAFASISKLKPGEITEIMPVPDAPGSKRVALYVVFKLLDRQAAGQRQLNDPRVQQFIRSQLRDGRSQLLKNAYIEMLRDQAHVENYFAEEIFKNSAQ
ncbi:MAG TPA: SurA N-terminal domain-containing protein [Acidisarcina sp.]